MVQELEGIPDSSYPSPWRSGGERKHQNTLTGIILITSSELTSELYHFVGRTLGNFFILGWHVEEVEAEVQPHAVPLHAINTNSN